MQARDCALSGCESTAPSAIGSITAPLVTSAPLASTASLRAASIPAQGRPVWALLDARHGSAHRWLSLDTGLLAGLWPKPGPRRHRLGELCLLAHGPRRQHAAWRSYRAEGHQRQPAALPRSVRRAVLLPPKQGSPIAKVHYSVLDASGKVIVPEKIAAGTNPIELSGIDGPKTPGNHQLKAWLEDSVGLSGTAAIAPIPRDTVPPAAPQELSVTAPETPRAAQGVDVRWRNIVDAGSPIDAVHYQVLRGSQVVVPTKTIDGENPQMIGSLDTPRERGGFSLRVWLNDAEGNVGAPVTAPLAYECVRSDVDGGTTLSAGFGGRGENSVLVRQKEGATLAGRLAGLVDQRTNAPLCIFSKVVTDQDQRFLGIAMTGQGGDYTFAVEAAPRASCRWSTDPASVS